MQRVDDSRLSITAFKLAVCVCLVTIVGPISAFAGNGQFQGPGNGQTYAIGLWGDLPYSTVQATVGVPNLIADQTDIRSSCLRCATR